MEEVKKTRHQPNRNATIIRKRRIWAPKEVKKVYKRKVQNENGDSPVKKRKRSRPKKKSTEKKVQDRNSSPSPVVKEEIEVRHYLDDIVKDEKESSSDYSPTPPPQPKKKRIRNRSKKGNPGGAARKQFMTNEEKEEFIARIKQAYEEGQPFGTKEMIQVGREIVWKRPACETDEIHPAYKIGNSWIQNFKQLNTDLLKYMIVSKNTGRKRGVYAGQRPPVPVPALTKKFNNNKVVTKEEEEELADELKQYAQNGSPCSTREIMYILREIIKKRLEAPPRKVKLKDPTKSRLEKFVKRFKVSHPEVITQTSARRDLEVQAVEALSSSSSDEEDDDDEDSEEESVKRENNQTDKTELEVLLYDILDETENTTEYLDEILEELSDEEIEENFVL